MNQLIYWCKGQVRHRSLQLMKGEVFWTKIINNHPGYLTHQLTLQSLASQKEVKKIEIMIKSLKHQIKAIYRFLIVQANIKEWILPTLFCKQIVCSRLVNFLKVWTFLKRQICTQRIMLQKSLENLRYYLLGLMQQSQLLQYQLLVTHGQSKRSKFCSWSRGHATSPPLCWLRIRT